MDILIHSDGSYELYHHGVKGQKWGVRRYQDYNGRMKRGHEKRYGEWPPKTGRQKRNSKQTSAKKRIEEDKRFIDKIDKEKAIKALKTTAAVASGTLWLASAITTGNLAAGANTIAAVSNLVAMVPHEG